MSLIRLTNNHKKGRFSIREPVFLHCSPVCFPEGFEKRHDTLKYTFESYEKSDLDAVQRRVEVVTDSVAALPQTPGIGQKFSRISNNVKLDELDNRPVSRPWNQDFSAQCLGKGNLKELIIKRDRKAQREIFLDFFDFR